MGESGNRTAGLAAIITALVGVGGLCVAIYDRMDRPPPAQARPALMQPLSLQPEALSVPAPVRTPAAGSPSVRPSFPCNLQDHRYEPFERAICDSAELSQADRDLQVAYQAARQRGDAERNLALKMFQRTWMTSRAGCGADAECLLAMYRERIEALAQANR
jgi:uncharacterized protein YecT (DUF1311 family)